MHTLRARSVGLEPPSSLPQPQRRRLLTLFLFSWGCFCLLPGFVSCSLGQDPVPPSSAQTLPSSVDLRPFFDKWGLTPRTQGKRGTCSVFAVVGALEFAAAKQQADTKALVDGVTLVLEQFKSVLSRHGLKEVGTAGAAFDPHQHDCISHQPSADVPAEKIMQVVRPGYVLNGRLLRPASVIVSSGPTPAEGVVI